MLNQIQDTMVAALVEKLHSYGINVDVETVKKAIANYPQLAQKVESILAASSSEEKLEKVRTLIAKAANGELFATETEETSTK